MQVFQVRVKRATVYYTQKIDYNKGVCGGESAGVIIAWENHARVTVRKNYIENQTVALPNQISAQYNQKRM